MAAIHLSRADIMETIKEFDDTLGYWRPKDSVSNALKHLPIFGDNILTGFLNFYNKYATDSLAKSPYRNEALEKSIRSLTNFAKQEMEAGNTDTTLTITSNARICIEKIITQVANIATTTSETKNSTAFQEGLSTNLFALLVDETSLMASVALGTIQDKSVLIPELQKIRRKLTTFGRVKNKDEETRRVKANEHILRHARDMIDKYDPDYNSDNDTTEVAESKLLPQINEHSEDSQDDTIPVKESHSKTRSRGIGGKRKRREAAMITIKSDLGRDSPRRKKIYLR